MAYKVYAIPNYTGTSEDLVAFDAKSPGSNGVVHYAYAVGAEENAIQRRMFSWAKIWDFGGDYGKARPEIIERLKGEVGYRPGEGVLESEGGSTDSTGQDTVMRLGALELLANLSSGRLSTNEKDPFPHQLALQQHIRNPDYVGGPRRLLIADEVGLGKTIEAGLILRDILLARGRLDDFRCLYLTSGGLVDDAAGKLRDVLSGAIDGNQIVDTVASFPRYGAGNTSGVYVASMHAARRYAAEGQKKHLPLRVQPQVVIIDECHHAASDDDLAGAEVGRRMATQTYLAAKQLLTGVFWAASEPPQLAILMSATPFRSGTQFVNLLRLLTDGVHLDDGSQFSAFASGVNSEALRDMLRGDRAAASVVWRRQSDDEVKSWSGNRIFPNLTILRPHRVGSFDQDTPRLPQPSAEFLDLLGRVKQAVHEIAKAHGQSFGGFATFQLEKKLTSSSIAGACWLFSYAVRHSRWATQAEFNKDEREGTAGLRRLIKKISQRIAEFDTQSATGHAAVSFPSDKFEFDAKSLAQTGKLSQIYDYSKQMRDESPDAWIADQGEVARLVALGESLLELGNKDIEGGGSEDAKLRWLRELLKRYPNDRFLLFTESLQTCATLKSALGSTCRELVGSMTRAAREAAVADLRNPRMNARVLVATSAADEGFDLQVANKVIHWDLSSSPATLMQRNGRVARLGQVADVTAYYLILAGTHEERRDSALMAKFVEMGINDEMMKSRILGSLSDDEEQQLEQAIEENEVGVVGAILRKAKDDNRVMDEELAVVRRNLDVVSVLGRDDLAKRLALWQELGPPDAAVAGVQLRLDTIAWDRPVFGEVTRQESARANVVNIKSERIKQDLTFDPEFLLFGPKDGERKYRLAGVTPWIHKVTRHGRVRICPFDESDLLGKMLHQISRLRAADFLSVGREDLAGTVERIDEVHWLLFCTHPLREAENTVPKKSRTFLTYYAFPRLEDGIDPFFPLNEEGADAVRVHRFLSCIEELALKEKLSGLSDESEITIARQVGGKLRDWVESVIKLGAASFLEEEKYYVPIPVALVRIHSGGDAGGA